jgi:hypothetical protein
LPCAVLNISAPATGFLNQAAGAEDQLLDPICM